MTQAQIHAFLRTLAAALSANRVRVTQKAVLEAAALGMLPPDLFLVLMDLHAADFYRAEEAWSGGSQPVWVFAPYDVAGNHLWIRLRQEGSTWIVVISFHEWDTHE